VLLPKHNINKKLESFFAIFASPSLAFILATRRICCGLLGGQVMGRMQRIVKSFSIRRVFQDFIQFLLKKKRKLK